MRELEVGLGIGNLGLVRGSTRGLGLRSLGLGEIDLEDRTLDL